MPGCARSRRKSAPSPARKAQARKEERHKGLSVVGPGPCLFVHHRLSLVFFDHNRLPSSAEHRAGAVGSAVIVRAAAEADR